MSPEQPRCSIVALTGAGGEAGSGSGGAQERLPAARNLLTLAMASGNL